MGNGCSCNAKAIDEDNVVKSNLIRNIRRQDISNTDDMEFIEKILINKINLIECQKNSYGPYFLCDKENKNVMLYKKFFQEIKLSAATYKSVTKDSEIDLKQLYSIKSLQEIQINYLLKQEKFNKLLKLFIRNPISELRILLYFLALSRNGSLYKLATVNKGDSPKAELMSINTLAKKNTKYDETYIRLINCDLPRTFPNKDIIQNKCFIDCVYSVLLEITVLDQEIGYVQGINNIVSYTLLLSGNNKDLCLTLFFSIMNIQSDLAEKKFKGKL